MDLPPSDASLPISIAEFGRLKIPVLSSFLSLDGAARQQQLELVLHLPWAQQNEVGRNNVCGIHMSQNQSLEDLLNCFYLSRESHVSYVVPLKQFKPLSQ